MTIDAKAIFAAVTSHAQALGVFDKVNGHEPKSAPASGLICSFWVEVLRPIPPRSGLASTSALLVLSARVQTTMLAEPADDIDPRILSATDALMIAYTGDFDLSGQVAKVDLLGAFWPAGLNARAGYLNQDSKLFRVMVVDIPLVINDAWSQSV